MPEKIRCVDDEPDLESYDKQGSEKKSAKTNTILFAYNGLQASIQSYLNIRILV